MQEQTTSSLSRWVSNPLTWAGKKLVNGTVDGLSRVFNSGAVLAVTFVTQIPTVLADYCFTVQGQFTPYLLNCADTQQLVNLSRDLDLQNPNVTSAPAYACQEIRYHLEKSYGVTALGGDACWLRYGQRLDPTVDRILRNNVQNGIFGGSGDALKVIILVGGGIALVTAIIYFSCRKLKAKWFQDGKEQGIVERGVDDAHLSAAEKSGGSGDSETTADNGEVTYVETDQLKGGPRPGYQSGCVMQ